MPGYLKEPPSVLKILFQRGTCDITTGEAVKKELKVAIALEFLYKKPSINEKISYTLVLMINHDGDSLDCVNYTSDVFNTNIGILWHCDDDNITQISDLPKGAYIGESHKKSKKKVMVGSTYVIFVVYIITNHMRKNSPIFFKNTPKCPK